MPTQNISHGLKLGRSRFNRLATRFHIYKRGLDEDGAIAVGAQRPETRHKHYMGKPTRWLQCPRKSDIEQIKHLELALPAFDTKCMVAALENFQFDVFKRFGVFMAATKLHAMMLLWKGAEGGDDLDVDDPDLISLAGGYRIMAERRKKDARRRRRWQNNTEE